MVKWWEHSPIPGALILDVGFTMAQGTVHLDLRFLGSWDGSW
jgi:hypothetical protein